MEKQEIFITIFDGSGTPKEIDLNRFSKNVITFGRNTENDIILESPIVSKKHGYFLLENGICSIFDLDSTNGIYIENVRVQKAILQTGNVIKIRDFVNDDHNTVTIVFGKEGNSSKWKGIDISRRDKITVGRDKTCDIVLNNTSISKIHAQIQREGNQWVLYNHGGQNSIIADGVIVNKKQVLKDKDVIIIANAKLLFSSNGINYTIYDEGINLEVKDITKTVSSSKGKINIVNHIGLSIGSGEFVAIIGGSGAGKSSFLNCISGYSRPTTGHVELNGDDLYENYEVLKKVIGYVPQSDIVYDNLTVKQMLHYAAKLRMPDDTSKQERISKVQEVIETVELKGHESKLIKKLSGGQKKRVSIAIELLSSPKLFFLDEPSSGLDPGTEEKLMETLRKMSRMGTTIILITHNTMNIHLCDKIIFLGRGGNLCYYGEAQKAAEFFGVDNLVKVYNMTFEQPELWKKHYLDVCGQRREDTVEKSMKNMNISAKVKTEGSPVRQMGQLISRNLRLILNDKKRLLMLLLQAPLLAYLVYLVSNEEVFKQYEITKGIMFALACCAFWVGILNSIQEICKERTILKREYLSGLSLGSYIGSKLVVMGIICAVESLLLSQTFLYLVEAPDDGVFLPFRVEIFLTTYLTAMAATATGLFISALVKNPDRAMTIAPIILMPQILFSGLAFSLQGTIEKISNLVVCRWSMEGFGTTADLNDLSLKIQSTIPQVAHESEKYYEYTALHLVFSWEILICFIIVFSIASYLAIRKMKKI